MRQIFYLLIAKSLKPLNISSKKYSKVGHTHCSLRTPSKLFIKKLAALQSKNKYSIDSELEQHITDISRGREM